MMRIIADKPMELLRGLVNDHLPRVMTLDGTGWLSDDAAPFPDPSRFVLVPPEMRTMPTDPAVAKVDLSTFATVDLSSLDARVVLHGPDGRSVRFEVVTALGPDIPTTPMILLVTSDGSIVIASHTKAGIRPDGVIQISGAEPGISLLTVPQLRASRGQKLLRNGSSVASFSVEHRTNGTWTRVEVKIDPSAIGMRELRLD